MKRSRTIDVTRMARYAVSRQAMKPLALAVLTATAMSCGNNEQETAEVFINPAECAKANPDQQVECAAAYRQALAEAVKAGPKYQSLEDCQAEFGEQNCVAYDQAAQQAAPESAPQPPPGQSWFMPALAGYMFGRMMGGGFQAAPMYTSFARNSPAYGKWTSVDGRTYGNATQRRVRVSPDTFRPKPAVSRTISRGGFGSTVAARSNWGGNRSGGASRSGWGG